MILFLSGILTIHFLAQMLIALRSEPAVLIIFGVCLISAGNLLRWREVRSRTKSFSKPDGGEIENAVASPLGRELNSYRKPADWVPRFDFKGERGNGYFPSASATAIES